MQLTITLAFLAGLVSFLSPCVLPLVPAYISYMGGRVTNTVSAQTSGTAVLAQPTLLSRLSTLTHGFAFVAGFTFIFVVIGLLSTAFVRQIGRQDIILATRIISHIGGIVIIFFGLHYMGVIRTGIQKFLQTPTLYKNLLSSLIFGVLMTALIVWALIDALLIIPVLAVFWLWLFLAGAFTRTELFWKKTLNRLLISLYADTRRQRVAKGQQSYSTSALMGIVFAAGWTPCIGPIYGSILTMAMTGQDVSEAGFLLMAYALGLGIPFLAAAFLLDSAQSLLRKLQRHIHTIERFAGVMLVVIGLLIATERLQTLSQNFAVQFADFSYNLEECVIELNSGEINFGGFISCIGDANNPQIS